MDLSNFNGFEQDRFVSYRNKIQKLQRLNQCQRNSTDAMNLDTNHELLCPDTLPMSF